jgi:Zn-dependent M28 family amino/carboxypeptidase
MRFRHALFAAVLSAALAAASLSPQEQAVLGHIRAESLQGHVAFLASDALEGRNTPSKGLEVAAEYIAATFRRAGIEPAVAGGSYFQNAAYERIHVPKEGLQAVLRDGESSLTLAGDRMNVLARQAVALDNLQILRIDITSETALEGLTPAGVAGKAVLIDASDLQGAMRQGRRAITERLNALRDRFQPAVLLSARLPIVQRNALREASEPLSVPNVQILDASFGEALAKASPAARVSLTVPAPQVESVLLKNVAGILRGADPALRDTYVLLTAHYDHVGVAASGEGDRIRNGANDNASGTAAVIEIAEALARTGYQPRRSIVFLLYFGEELGLVGSRYYAKAPLFPLARTVANLNLEQLGRTDDPAGDRTHKITATGFDYTSIGEVLRSQSARVDVEAWHDEKNSDMFFSRSDNQPLADAGIPAVTLGVAWTFPDYHRPTDHWDKLNYPHLARIAKAVTLTTLAIANDAEPPHWIATNPKTARYLDAAKKLAAPGQ